MISFSRRRFLSLGSLALATACTSAEERALATHSERDWRAHFADLGAPAILIDTEKRRLFFWSNGSDDYAEFPIGVARSEELLRRGRTSVVRKTVGPGWTPTPSMRRQYPDLPARVPPGPDSPMGSHALYLGWTYYAIHGTNDARSVGYPTTSGCFRMFNSNVKWLYDRAPVGTRVRVI